MCCFGKPWRWLDGKGTLRRHRWVGSELRKVKSCLCVCINLGATKNARFFPGLPLSQPDKKDPQCTRSHPKGAAQFGKAFHASDQQASCVTTAQLRPIILNTLSRRLSRSCVKKVLARGTFDEGTAASLSRIQKWV